VLRKALSMIKRLTAQKQVTSAIAYESNYVIGHENCPSAGLCTYTVCLGICMHEIAMLQQLACTHIRICT
jgi:hypothetical protein